MTLTESVSLIVFEILNNLKPEDKFKTIEVDGRTYELNRFSYQHVTNHILATRRTSGGDLELSALGETEEEVIQKIRADRPHGWTKD